MIRMSGGEVIREGWSAEETITGYTLEGLPDCFTKGSVEIVRTRAAYRELKVYYARVHLWTTGRDLLTLTTTSQGEWLTESECMDSSHE